MGVKTNLSPSVFPSQPPFLSCPLSPCSFLALLLWIITAIIITTAVQEDDIYWVFLRHLALGAEVLGPMSDSAEHLFSASRSAEPRLARRSRWISFPTVARFVSGNTKCRTSLVNVTVKYNGCKRRVRMARCTGECRTTIRWVCVGRAPSIRFMTSWKKLSS